MRYYLTIPAMATLALLQGVFFSQVSLLGVHPNVLLVVAVCWAMVRTQEEAMVLVPLAGLILGLITSDDAGLAVLALTPTVVLASIRRVQIIENQLLLTLGIVLMSTVAYYLIEGLVLAILGYRPAWGPIFRHSFLAELVTNLALTPPVFGLLWLASPDIRYRAQGIPPVGRLRP